MRALVSSPAIGAQAASAKVDNAAAPKAPQGLNATSASVRRSEARVAVFPIITAGLRVEVVIPGRALIVILTPVDGRTPQSALAAILRLGFGLGGRHVAALAKLADR